MSSVQTDRESVAQHLCDALNENHRLRHALNDLVTALREMLYCGTGGKPAVEARIMAQAALAKATKETK